MSSGKKESWIENKSRCPLAQEGFEPYHKWIPMSQVKTPGSETVTMMICGICFHEVNLSEAHKYRDVLSS